MVVTHKKDIYFRYLKIYTRALIGCTILSLPLFVSFLTYDRYQNWERLFFTEDRKEHIYCDNSKGFDTAKEKIKDFNQNTNEIAALELTQEEVMSVLIRNINSTAPNGLVVVCYYVEGKVGSWDVFLKLRYKGSDLPWVKIVCQKEEFETPILFFSRIDVGPYDVMPLGGRVLLDRMNKGYSDSIILINQEGLTGRKIENIELEKNKIIFKGRKS